MRFAVSLTVQQEYIIKGVIIGENNEKYTVNRFAVGNIFRHRNCP